MLLLLLQGKRAATAEVFEDALKAAAGAAPKDNPAQLRKAIKRREKAKEVSAKQWGERKAKESSTKAKAQSKREDNLKARSGKGAAAAAEAEAEEKQPRQRQMRPGFEGKKEDFLVSHLRPSVVVLRVLTFNV
jgi:Mg-chelatase subunit ChlI